MNNPVTERLRTLIFIINGVNVPVEVDIKNPLSMARDTALVDSNNTGRPYCDWEVRNEDGYRLDVDKTIEELDLQDGDRIFLNLKVGFGGNKSNLNSIPSN